jgi:hypothetical protein
MLFRNNAAFRNCKHPDAAICIHARHWFCCSRMLQACCCCIVASLHAVPGCCMLHAYIMLHSFFLFIMLIKFFIIFIIFFFFFFIFVPKPFFKFFKNFFKSDLFSNISHSPFLDTSLINKSLHLKHFSAEPSKSFFLFKQSQILHNSLYKKIPIVFEKSSTFSPRSSCYVASSVLYSFFFSLSPFFKSFDFPFFNSCSALSSKKYYLQQVKIKRFLFNFWYQDSKPKKFLKQFKLNRFLNF